MKKYLPEGITRQERTAILNGDMRSSIPSICLERARLVTKSYQKSEGEPYLLRRAKALSDVLDNMTIFIRPEERTPRPKIFTPGLFSIRNAP